MNGEASQNRKRVKKYSILTRIIVKNSTSTEEVSKQEYRIRVKNDALERRNRGWTSEP